MAYLPTNIRRATAPLAARFFVRKLTQNPLAKEALSLVLPPSAVGSANEPKVFTHQFAEAHWHVSLAFSQWRDAVGVRS